MECFFVRSVKPLIEYFESRRLNVILEKKRISGIYSSELLDELLVFFDSLYSFLDEVNIFVYEVSENIEKFSLEPIFSFDGLSKYFDYYSCVIVRALHQDLWTDRNQFVASIHNDLASLKYFHFVDVIANSLAFCLRDVVEDKIKISTVSEAYASLNIAKALRVYETMSVHSREVYEKQNTEQIKIYQELRSCFGDFDIDGCIDAIVANDGVRDYHEVVERMFNEIERQVFRPNYDSTKDGKGTFDKWNGWGISMINFYYSEKINSYL